MEEMSIEEAIKIMQGWLDYNKRNRKILREADTIIAVQEKVLSELDRRIAPEVIEDKVNQLNNEIDEYKECCEKGKEKDVEYYENIGNEVARDILEKLLNKEEIVL